MSYTGCPFSCNWVYHLPAPSSTSLPTTWADAASQVFSPMTYWWILTGTDSCLCIPCHTRCQYIHKYSVKYQVPYVQVSLKLTVKPRSLWWVLGTEADTRTGANHKLRHYDSITTLRGAQKKKMNRRTYIHTATCMYVCLAAYIDWENLDSEPLLWTDTGTTVWARAIPQWWWWRQAGVMKVDSKKKRNLGTRASNKHTFGSERSVTAHLIRRPSSTLCERYTICLIHTYVLFSRFEFSEWSSSGIFIRQDGEPNDSSYYTTAFVRNTNLFTSYTRSIMDRIVRTLSQLSNLGPRSVQSDRSIVAIPPRSIIIGWSRF